MKLSDEDVEWIVNDTGELGVKIGNQFFFLYKGRSYQCEGKWRPVYKREFGECCHSDDYYKFAEITGDREVLYPDYDIKRAWDQRKGWDAKDYELFGKPYEWKDIPK